ncbi:MAG: hypothetical protein MK101_06790 [Phycisphaerales bacterium]|nr:hypothetical protein [Phycisphaerales bacterium]
MSVPALLLTLLASGPDVLHAIFDGAQEGTLEAMTLDRPAAAVQGDGTIVGPHGPRWGGEKAYPMSVAGWRQVVDAGGSIPLMLAGVDHDDETPLLVTYNVDQMRLQIRLGEALGGAPVLDHSSRRIVDGEVVVDVLHGTGLQEPDKAFRPRAGTVLPGCVLLLCQRSRLMDDGSDAWLAEGVSVIAIEHLGRGWVWRVIGHVDPIGGDDTALGRGRICSSSMSNVFPDPDGVVDGRLVDAWIPFVDYLHHIPDPATAGQCMMLRAKRSDTSLQRWSFEGPLLLHEFHSGAKRHTHAAAWTPNGVLLGIGDGADSEVALLTCEDWDRWTDLDLWTIHHDVHGAPLVEGEGGDVGANQFWSAASSPDPDTVIVGGDNVSGAIMRVRVPEDPAEGIRFERIWGVQPGRSHDNGTTQCTCSHMVRPRPELSGPLLARFYLESPLSNIADARLLLSPDCNSFATVGGLRAGSSRLSPVALHGEAMVLTPMNSQIESGLWTQPVPTLVQQRPLQLGPASVDQLQRDDMVGALSVNAQPGVSVTDIPRKGAGELSAHAAEAPGLNPVWRIKRESTGDEKLASITIPAPQGGWPEGSLWVQGWMSNLTAGMLRPTFRLDLGANDVYRQVAIASERQWVPVEIISTDGDPTVGAMPSLDIHVPTFADLPSPPADFLFTLSSVTLAEPPPWPAADTISQRPPERMSIDLPETAPPWTLELELCLPPEGLDRSLGQEVESVTLFQLDLVDGTWLEVIADLRYDRLRLMRMGQGEPVEIMKAYRVRLSRLDALHIAIAANLGKIGIEGVSGGRREPGELIPGTSLPTLPAMTRLHMGDADRGVDIAMELMQISLWPNEARLDMEFEAEVPAPICPADFDGDGQVTGSDVLFVLSNWGDCPEGEDAPECVADLTGDAVVDISDLLEVLIDLGPCPGSE